MIVDLWDSDVCGRLSGFTEGRFLTGDIGRNEFEVIVRGSTDLWMDGGREVGLLRGLKLDDEDCRLWRD